VKDRSFLRVILGGKSLPPAPPPPPAPPETERVKAASNALFFLGMVREKNNLNMNTNFPWVTVRRALMIEEDIAVTERFIKVLLENLKANGL
jgi:hypothetical protein